MARRILKEIEINDMIIKHADISTKGCDIKIYIFVN